MIPPFEFSLRYRTASGSVRDLWEWDAANRAVIVTIGGRAIAIPVCIARRPRHGAFFIGRINLDAWRVMPSVYALVDGVWHARHEVWDAILEPAPIVLTHAPEDVSAAIEEA